MIRSLFFAPANRHDMLAKFPRFGADCCVLDLEDGTPATDRDQARARLNEAVQMLRGAGLKGLIYVRVNSQSSPDYRKDVDATLACDIDGIILPKIEHADMANHLASEITVTASRRPAGRAVEIMGGIETMRGVVDAISICKSNPLLTSVYFGAEDFAADLGARRTRGGDEVLYARSQVVLAARLAGITAIDQAVTQIRDDEFCRLDAGKGRDLGYQGKISLTPRQVAICNEVFSPSDTEIEHAKALLDTYAEAQQKGIGTIDFRGQMIDGPLVKRAEAVMNIARVLQQRNSA